MNHERIMTTSLESSPDPAMQAQSYLDDDVILGEAGPQPERIFDHPTTALFYLQTAEFNWPLCGRLEGAVRTLYLFLRNPHRSNPRAFLPLAVSLTQLYGAHDVRSRNPLHGIFASLIPSLSKRALRRKMREIQRSQVKMLTRCSTESYLIIALDAHSRKSLPPPAPCG